MWSRTARVTTNGDDATSYHGGHDARHHSRHGGWHHLGARDGAGEVIATDNFNKLGEGIKVACASRAGEGKKAARPARQKQHRKKKADEQEDAREPVPAIHSSSRGHVACSWRRLCWSGLVAYQQLPVSALPEVDFPTIQVVTFYPGASPDVMASAVTAPLERQFGQVPGLNQMTSISSGGSSVITLQFALYLNIDVAEQEVQAAINAAQTYLPRRPAQPAHLQQIQSGGRSHPDPGADLEVHAAFQGGGSGRHAAGAENFPIARRGSGHALSAAKSRRCACRPIPTALSAYGLNLEDLRTALQQTSINQAKGNFDGPQTCLSDRRQRPTGDQRGIQQAGRRLSQWRAGHAFGRGQGGGWRRKHQASRLDEHTSRPSSSTSSASRGPTSSR